MLAADDEILLPQHRHETKTKLLGRRTQAKAAIGHAGRNAHSHGKVRWLFGLVADDFARLDPMKA